MDDAVLVASIRKRVIEHDRKLYEQWMTFLEDAFAQMIEDAIGITPTDMRRESAPEHERSGHG